MTPSRTVAVSISASVERVYAFAADPGNLPRWAPGFVKAVTVTGRRCVAETTLGPATFTFAPPNPFGVLDHDVAMPSGETFHNPMRVIPNGGGSEVLFTMFRPDGMPAEAFEADAETVRRDLETLKALVEGSLLA